MFRIEEQLLLFSYFSCSPGRDQALCCELWQVYFAGCWVRVCCVCVVVLVMGDGDGDGK